MKIFTATAVLALRACAVADTELLSFLGLSSESHSGLTLRQLAMMPEKHTLDNIEATVLNLAKKREDGNGTGSNLDEFLDDILNITNITMKANILERKDATQAELDALVADFDANCIHPSTESLYTDLYSYNATHINCRMEEAVKFGEYQTCSSQVTVLASGTDSICSAYVTAKVFPDPTELCQMAEGTEVPTIGNYLNTMRDAYYELWKALKEKREACENATEPSEPVPSDCTQARCAYEDKNLECDGYQKDFEDEACALSRGYTCSKYSQCYAANKQTYDSTVTSAQDAEAGYKAEWRSVMRIECLIHALYNDTHLEQEITACKEKTHSTEPVELDYPVSTGQAEQACKEDDFVWRSPSQNEHFSSHWYSVLPTGAIAQSCACACCGQTDFVPSYPADVDFCPWTADADSDADAEMDDPTR